jgi:hypothetical protein
MFRFYSLFACTVFLSSFLLFQVQPLIGKHILPWYGGSSAVWVTALFFFMVALAVGYLYVLWLARFSYRVQIFIHAAILLATTVSLYVHTNVWPSGITPRLGDLSLSVTDPTVAVFVTLAIAIGLPFTVLSATSSLLQLWYARVSGSDPASLYSISNIGSLLGLLSYPFFIEPLMNTYAQGSWWVVGMALYIGLMVGVMLLLWRSVPAERWRKMSTEASVLGRVLVSRRQFLVWVGVASVPVMGLLTGTVFMTTMVAPIPLLWVGPLALYLLSFIWSFRANRPPSHTELYQLITFSVSVMVLVITLINLLPAVPTVIIIHGALLAIFHWCHEYLYRNRPAPQDLPLFYVALSLGGIVGSVMVKVSSLYILTMPIELQLLLVGVILTIGYNWMRNGLPDGLPIFLRQMNRRLAFTVLVLYMIWIGSYGVYARQQGSIEQFRNFYGYKAVVEREREGEWTRQLFHGQTNHGFQVYADGASTITPVSYYGPTSGLGLTFEHLRATKTEPLSVAVVGLGSGSLAAYCEPGDTFFFVEIDPQVVEAAYEYFTFLPACERSSVVTADARLTLEQQLISGIRGAYDLIILDAYADDMMPMHLMTKEALAVYKELLTEDGMLLIHISSRYLSLFPVVAGVGHANDFAVRGLFDHVTANSRYVSSYWTVLADDETAFAHEAFTRFQIPDPADDVVWTDTYSAIFPVIKLW